jgi:uncharacterized membrane protein YGL010W
MLAIIAVATLIALLAGVVGALVTMFVMPWILAIAGDRHFTKRKEKP